MPGQHRKELSTMTAKVQKMMKRLQNNGGTWEEGERALLFTGTESWGEKKKKKSMNACWVYFRSTRKEAKSSVVVGVFKQIRGFLLNHGQIL